MFLRHSYLATWSKWALGLGFFLLCFPISPALGGTVEDAQSIISQLSPINLALGPLIDRAISKGDDALAKRLRQFQEIIQETLATADAIAGRRISDLDSRAQNRLGDVRNTVSDSIGQFRDVVDGRVTIVDERVQQRIRQVQTELGGTVEAINWLAVDPVVDIGPEGISVYKQTGNTTAVFMAGIGLRKADKIPEASMSIGGQELEIKVESSSPSGLKLLIDNAKLPKTGSQEYLLRLRFSRGYSLSWLSSVVPDSINMKRRLEVSLPLVIFVLGPYSVDASIAASGERWDRITAESNMGFTPNVDCPKGASQSANIYAKAAGDYEIDGAVGHAGLTVDECTGREEHSCTWTADHLNIWCSAEHSDRGGYSRAVNARSHLRRRVPATECGRDTAVRTDLRYAETVQIKFDVSKAIGSCNEAGLSATPQLTAKVIVHRPYGASDVEKSVRVAVPTPLDDDPVRLVLNADGILDVALSSTFHWRYAPAHAAQ